MHLIELTFDICWTLRNVKCLNTSEMSPVGTLSKYFYARQFTSGHVTG